MSESQLPAEEVARLGDQWYHDRVRPLVEASCQGSTVAIDVLTGDYALGDTSLAAARLLRAAQPHAEVWLVRVGHRTLHHRFVAPEKSACGSLTLTRNIWDKIRFMHYQRKQVNGYTQT